MDTLGLIDYMFPSTFIVHIYRVADTIIRQAEIEKAKLRREQRAREKAEHEDEMVSKKLDTISLHSFPKRCDSLVVIFCVF